jgi:hypothetical protein
VALPIARGEAAFQEVGVRVAAVAFLALVAGVAHGWSPLVPVAAALGGGLYAAELAIDDAPLDVAAPAVAAGLLLCTELAYWSLEERIRWQGEDGDGLRRAAFIALLGLAALVVATVLLAIVDAVRARGLALDLVGATAAVAVVAAVLVITRSERQPRSGS